MELNPSLNLDKIKVTKEKYIPENKERRNKSIDFDSSNESKLHKIQKISDNNSNIFHDEVNLNKLN